MSKKDWCSSFPESWYSWRFKKVDISECCKKHDNEPDEGEEFKGCSSTKFFKCLRDKKIVGGSLIFLIASIACWVMYPKQQKERI